MPTLNRHDFVLRALNYYSSVGFKGYICIGDSSTAEAVEKTKRAIEPLRKKLNIVYNVCPPSPRDQGLDPVATSSEAICVKELIEAAPTKYAALAPDDDFQIPNGMYECVEFLESHDDYIAAHGSRLNFQLSGAGANDDISDVYYARQPDLEASTASQRWSAYMRNSVSPAYSVSRTESLRRIYRDLEMTWMRYIGSELIPSGTTPLLGKVKELDSLSTMHQINDARVWGMDIQGMYAMIMHPRWHNTVVGVRDSISNALSEVDKIDKSEAEAIFDREFWHLITISLQWQFNSAYEAEVPLGTSGIEHTIAEAVKKIPFARSMTRRFRFFRDENKVVRDYEKSTSLTNLLKPDSPFHADFMPVYRAITDGSPA